MNMRAPLAYRKSIPVFYEKSETEFQKDPYERYDDMIIRQSALHLADELWGTYPIKKVADLAKPYLSNSFKNILEIGCGVGRWISNLAEQFPEANCWGLDFSYQMLKRANEFWKEGDSIYLDLRSKGADKVIEVPGKKISNLQFGLAKAEDLPMGDSTQDLVLNSFLIDRLDAPDEGLREMYRVLKPGGKIILVSPLNFSKKHHWDAFHPPIKIYTFLQKLGFQIVDWQEQIWIEEPLDLRGNAVKWNCIGIVAEK